MTSTKESTSLSLRMYDALECVGNLEYMRQFKRWSTSLAEMLDQVNDGNSRTLKDSPNIRSFVGSYYENSVTPDLDSDIDTVLIDETFTVVTEVNDLEMSAPVQEAYLVLTDAYTPPGYTKLQFILQGRPHSIYDKIETPLGTKLSEIINKVILEKGALDNNGKFCLDNVRSITYNTEQFKAETNGPAYAVFKQDGFHEFDHVFCLWCKKIPANAKGWINRPRVFGWPSEHMLNKMSRMECLFVRKGSDESSEQDLLWRLSFTLQEKCLMSSLNPTQHKVYVLMKMIKRDMEKANKSLLGAIRSYALKCCILFVVEKTPAENWKAERLMKCLMYTLAVFREWVRNSRCPNFFIPEQNVFRSYMSKTKQQSLLVFLNALLSKGETVIASNIQCDRLGDIIKTFDVATVRLAKRRFEGYLVQNKLFVAGKILICGRQLILQHLPHSPIHISSVTRSILQYKHLERYTSEQKQELVELVLPWIHLHVALGLVSNPSYFRNSGKLINNHFEKAKNTDAINLLLAKATVYLYNSDLKQCVEQLSEIDIALDRGRAITYCGCRVTDYHDGNQPFPGTADSPVQSYLYNHWAYCTVFLRSEEKILPYALTLESKRASGENIDSMGVELREWHDVIIIDSKIYHQFLAYCVFSALGNSGRKTGAIQKLHEVLREDRFLCHEDTAYNLLGWIYMQENLYGFAVQCFLKSWQYQQRFNAAKFHMLELIRNLFRKLQQAAAD